VSATTGSTFLSEQTSNQPAVLFSQSKPPPAISHQPTEQAENLTSRDNNQASACSFGWWLMAGADLL
jgi:hypothetical protein